MSDPIDFLALAKAETNARKRMRFLALAHFQEGHSRTDIARFLKVSRTSVNKWVSNFLRLQGTDIQTYIEREFCVAYELSNVYRLLRELGFSWITSRSRHPKQDGQVQEAFKKLPAGNDP